MKSNSEVIKRQENITQAPINDTRKEVLFYNDILTNPLEKSLLVYSRKIEKIVTALYLVTDVMDDDLPLTLALRHESLELLNGCYQVMTGGPNRISVAQLTQIMIRLEHVISLISIGRIAHHISEMNAQVLITELEKVLKCLGDDTRDLSRKYTSYLEPRVDVEEPQPILSHTLLDDPMFDELERNRKRQKDGRDLRDTKDSRDNKEIKDIKTTFTKEPRQNDRKIGPGVRLGLPAQNGSVVVGSNQNDIVKNYSNSKTTFTNGVINNRQNVSSGIQTGSGRQQGIINVIKSHNNASMQDIAKFVTGCSEKTLQRELVSLIQAGVVRKVGDKRWATYHLI